MEKTKCVCVCHSMWGLYIAGLGLTFLLKNLGVISDDVTNMVWPSIIILAGLHKSCARKCKCCSQT